MTFTECRKMWDDNHGLRDLEVMRMVTPGGVFTEHRLPSVLWPARLGGVPRASLMTGRLESCPPAHSQLPELPEDMGLQIVGCRRPIGRAQSLQQGV